MCTTPLRAISRISLEILVISQLPARRGASKENIQAFVPWFRASPIDTFRPRMVCARMWSAQGRPTPTLTRALPPQPQTSRKVWYCLVRNKAYLSSVAQARLDPLSRERCSNTPVALCFPEYPNQLLKTTLRPFAPILHKRPYRGKGALQGRGIVLDSGVFGLSHSRGSRAR